MKLPTKTLMIYSHWRGKYQKEQLLPLWGDGVLEAACHLCCSGHLCRYLVTCFKYLLQFFFSFFFFRHTCVISHWAEFGEIQESTVEDSRSVGPPLIQGTMTGDMGDLIATKNELFLNYYVFNSFALNWLKLYIFKVWIIRQSENLNLALQRTSITYFIFCTLVQIDMMTRPVWRLVGVPWGQSA